MSIRDEVHRGIQDYLGCELDDVLHLARSDDVAWYAAVKHQGDVIGLAILVTMEEMRATRIKIIPESAGPFAFTAPAEVLDLLTPVENETALIWRQNCRNIMAGKEIYGDPYSVFTGEFDQHPEGVVNFANEAERRAYDEGIQARLDDLEMHKAEEKYSAGSLTYLKFMDGWLYADQQIMVQEILAREAQTSPSDKKPDPFRPGKPGEDNLGYPVAPVEAPYDDFLGLKGEVFKLGPDDDDDGPKP